MRRTPGIAFAFDRSSFNRATDGQVIRSAAPYLACVKVGLEAWSATDRASKRTVESLTGEFCSNELALDVFRDFKLADIKNTVASAVHNIGAKGTKFLTLHAFVSDEALEWAANAASAHDMTLLAVTVLTDLDDDQCISRFGDATSNTVGRFAKNAYAHGIRGFVCSAREVPVIRDNIPDNVFIVTPSIRPEWYRGADEQKRVVTPTMAARLGADMIVCGRAIRSADDARRIREELDAV